MPFCGGILAAHILVAQANAKRREELEKQFNALPREEQQFQLLKRQTQALERIARQGPPQVIIKNHSSFF